MLIRRWNASELVATPEFVKITEERAGNDERERSLVPEFEKFGRDVVVEHECLGEFRGFFRKFEPAFEEPAENPFGSLGMVAEAFLSRFLERGMPSWDRERFVETYVVEKGGPFGSEVAVSVERRQFRVVGDVREYEKRMSENSSFEMLAEPAVRTGHVKFRDQSFQEPTFEHVRQCRGGVRSVDYGVQVRGSLFRFEPVEFPD